MVVTITEILAQWETLGIFGYFLPFLLIFAVVYAILDTTKLLGENKAIKVIISLAIGLLALQFEMVPVFFSSIFSKFAIGLAVFLVVLIMAGFFLSDKKDWKKSMAWVGWVVGIGVVIWAASTIETWGGQYSGVSTWFGDYFWYIVLLGGLIGMIIWATKDNKKKEGE